MLPGGVGNPDQLREDETAVRSCATSSSRASRSRVICHGPWTLVEAGVVRGRTLTSWPSLQTDIRNAGGNWVDEEVTSTTASSRSRKPDDLPAFCRKLVEEFEGGQARPPGGIHESELHVGTKNRWRTGLEPATTGTTTRSSTN